MITVYFSPNTLKNQNLNLSIYIYSHILIHISRKVAGCVEYGYLPEQQKLSDRRNDLHNPNFNSKANHAQQDIQNIFAVFKYTFNIIFPRVASYILIYVLYIYIYNSLLGASPFILYARYTILIPRN